MNKEIIGAAFFRLLIVALAIAVGYLFVWIGWFGELDFPYIAGVLFVTLFEFGRDWEKYSIK